MTRLPLIALCAAAAFAACQPTTAPHPTPHATTHTTTPGAEVDPTAAGSAAPAPAAAGSGVEVAAARPDWTGPQPCTVDAECRVIQPGDWSADVECCYEYGCDLDYVAVNQATADAQRAWQRANPFDCAEHLRSHGPCETRVPVCGLDQAPPPVACVAQQCAIVWPTPWPVVAPDGQACAVDADCVAFRPSSTLPQTRCCNFDCSTHWVAITHATLREVQDWLGQATPSCETWLEGRPCPQAAPCSVTTPAVRCSAGVCALATP